MPVPTCIDGAAVLAAADVRAARRTGNTRHLVDGALRVDFSYVAIARYHGSDEVYLLYCDDEWAVVTDTCHDDVRAAVDQARFEFDGVELEAVPGSTMKPGEHETFRPRSAPGYRPPDGSPQG
jgi:hypothetical protein